MEVSNKTSGNDLETFENVEKSGKIDRSQCDIVKLRAALMQVDVSTSKCIRKLGWIGTYIKNIGCSRSFQNFRKFQSFLIHFRLPVEMPLRQNWINAIKEHQQFTEDDEHSLRYVLCANHFKPEHFEKVKIDKNGFRFFEYFRCLSLYSFPLVPNLFVYFLRFFCFIFRSPI